MTEAVEPFGDSFWHRLWQTRVPPHTLALLRIALGVVGLMKMAGMTPLDLHWSADGIVPLPGGGSGLRAWVVTHGLGTFSGWALYVFMTTAFAGMVAGYRSELCVLAAYAGLILESYWNRLPLSSAHPAMATVMFCLIWAQTGRIWTLDGNRSRLPQTEAPLVPAWPLYLIRCQLSVIYFTTGLWKVLSPAWRDGSAVHWALNVNTFHRFPWTLPAALDPLLSAMTWGTLFFELAVPVLVLFRRTRAVTLLAGVGLHLGMGLTMELGLFSWVMLASYPAFLDPVRFPSVLRRLRTFLSKAPSPVETNAV